VSFWTAKTGGTQLTDLQDMSNNAISTVSTDLNGLMPQFQGPNTGVDTLWADAGGTRVQLLAKDLVNEFAQASAVAAATAIAAAIDQTTLPTVPVMLAGVVANNQTASYTLVLADAGRVVEVNNAAAVNLTVPPNASVAFPVGTVVEVWQQGAGQVTVVAGAGVTIRTPSTLLLRAQYSSVTLRKRATNEWVIGGDTT
jgi:hypothetical protein